MNLYLNSTVSEKSQQRKTLIFWSLQSTSPYKKREYGPRQYFAPPDYLGGNLSPLLYIIIKVVCNGATWSGEEGGILYMASFIEKYEGIISEQSILIPDIIKNIDEP